MQQTRSIEAGSSIHARLWIEFGLLFVVTPLVMAFLLSPAAIWAGIAAMLAVAIALLWLTPSFRWRSLLARPFVPHWGLFAGFVLLTSISAIALVLWLRPGTLFFLPRYNQDLWLLILCFYPFGSALPQELIFRALFFERYGGLFADQRVAVTVNAGVFSLAHLFFWNWPAVLLTALGGAVFALAYRGGGAFGAGSFGFAFLLHALAGQILFTTGLGIFFYHGAV